MSAVALPEAALAAAGLIYGVPPAAFTAARAAAASTLREGGDPESANWVKRLPKPSTAAWILNHLWRTERAEIQKVLDFGAELRAAQAELDGPQLRALSVQRRKLTDSVSQVALKAAAAAGVSVAGAVRQQVADTLTAAMLEETAAGALKSGLLIRPLSPADPQDAALAVAGAEFGQAAAGAPSTGPSSVGNRSAPAKAQQAAPQRGRGAAPGIDPPADLAARRQVAREQAAAELARAQEHLNTVQQARSALESIATLRATELDTVNAEQLQARARVDELERDLATAEDDLARVLDAVEAAQHERDQAQELVEAASQELQLAEGALEKARTAARKYH